MNKVAQVLAALEALTLLAVGVMEAFFYRSPELYAIFLIEPGEYDAVRLWTVNVGFYNIFMALGLIVALVFVNTGRVAAGRTIVLYTSALHVLLGFTLVVSEPHGVVLARLDEEDGVELWAAVEERLHHAHGEQRQRLEGGEHLCDLVHGAHSGPRSSPPHPCPPDEPSGCRVLRYSARVRDPGAPPAGSLAPTAEASPDGSPTVSVTGSPAASPERTAAPQSTVTFGFA